MKLDATDFRYLKSDEFRVLAAVEIGSKNHEVVPTTLITQISRLRGGGVNSLVSSLAKRNLVSKVQSSKYDGYKLTYGGYDYLAMRALSKRETLFSVGNKIGVGKESDIYIVADNQGKRMVMKLHRLGRISFRAVKQKRDYLGKRNSSSWMYLSRLSAQKEWAYMKFLYERGFPVPTPIDQARHCILMEFIEASPLHQISHLSSPGTLYISLMKLIVRLASVGLIHGDFNEFNILIRRESTEPVVIDFPQMVSTAHDNAQWYFERDVECIRTFFRRRFHYEDAYYPRFMQLTKGNVLDWNGSYLVASTDCSDVDIPTPENSVEKKQENCLESLLDDDRSDHGTESEPGKIRELHNGSGRKAFQAEMGDAGLVSSMDNLELKSSGTSSDAQCQGSTSSPVLSTHRPSINDIRDVVSLELKKTRASQYKKFHSKKATRVTSQTKPRRSKKMGAGNSVDQTGF